MSAETDIYSFETIFAQALQAVLNGRDVRSYTILDAPNFQNDRPRTEIIFVPGSGRGRWNPARADLRETAWKGAYNLFLITDANVQAHSAYVALVRSIMHGIDTAINGAEPMTRHRLQAFFRDGGTSPSYKPEDGVYETRMIYEVDFSVQADAWAALES